MSPVPRFSIVAPCYNESRNLAPLLAAFSVRLERDDFELIVVDNGSSDGTAEELRRLLPLYSFARSVRVEVKRLGRILSGLPHFRRYVGWTPAPAVRPRRVAGGRAWRGGRGLFRKACAGGGFSDRSLPPPCPF